MPAEDVPAAAQPGLQPAWLLELQEVYDGVPATRCASSGECCQLTDAEFASAYATMFPLYRVEYLNVVEHVRAVMPQARQQELAAFTVERPRRCPFLDVANGCTIYPARPLICRTYGVMNQDTIAAAMARHRGDAPRAWLARFQAREGCMMCPRVRVTEPDKVAAHAARLIRFEYERSLTRLSRQMPLLDAERQQIFTRITGRAELPVRWSFGAYNAVCNAPLDWLRADFARYWMEAELADAS